MNLKKLNIVLFLLLFVKPVFCQNILMSDKITGVEISGGISRFISQINSDSFYYIPNYSFYYYFGKQYSKTDLTLNIGLIKKGAEKKSPQWKYNMYYISISPLIDISFITKKRALFIGGYANLLVKDNIYGENEELVSLVKNGINKFDYGMILGYKLAFYTKNNYSLSLNMRVEYSLFSIYNNEGYYLSDWNSKWDKNLSFQLGVKLKKITNLTKN